MRNVDFSTTNATITTTTKDNNKDVTVHPSLDDAVVRDELMPQPPPSYLSSHAQTPFAPHSLTQEEQQLWE